MGKRTLTYGALALALLFALSACESGAEREVPRQEAAEQAAEPSSLQGAPGQNDRFAIHTRDSKVKLALTDSLVYFWPSEEAL